MSIFLDGETIFEIFLVGQEWSESHLSYHRIILPFPILYSRKKNCTTRDPFNLNKDCIHDLVFSRSRNRKSLTPR